MKSILDPSFRYTKSVETDLRKTFARVRRELRQQQQEHSQRFASKRLEAFFLFLLAKRHRRGVAGEANETPTPTCYVQT